MNGFKCNVALFNTTTEDGENAGSGRVLVGGDIAVGESISCEGSYVLTSDDIDALEVVGSASVWAFDMFGAEVTDSSAATTTLDQVRKRIYSIWTVDCFSVVGD